LGRLLATHPSLQGGVLVACQETHSNLNDSISSHVYVNLARRLRFTWICNRWAPRVSYNDSCTSTLYKRTLNGP